MVEPREAQMKKYKIHQQRDGNSVFGDALKLTTFTQMSRCCHVYVIFTCYNVFIVRGNESLIGLDGL